MKLFFKISLLIFLLNAFNTVAQEATKMPCSDSAMHTTMIDLNNEGLKKGYSIKMFTKDIMPSGGYFPIKVKLKKGIEHIINFSTHKKARNIRITVIDINNKHVAKSKGKQNQAVLSFIPEYSGTYLIVLQQKVRRKKHVCGAFSILEKGISNNE